MSCSDEKFSSNNKRFAIIIMKAFLIIGGGSMRKTEKFIFAWADDSPPCPSLLKLPLHTERRQLELRTGSTHFCCLGI